MVTHSADTAPTVSCARPRSTRSLVPATSIEALIDQQPKYDCRAVPPRSLVHRIQKVPIVRPMMTTKSRRGLTRLSTPQSCVRCDQVLSNRLTLTQLTILPITLSAIKRRLK